MIKSVLLSVFIKIIFPEGERRMFIRNVDNHLPDYVVFTIYRKCIPFPVGNVSMCTLYTQMGTGLSRWMVAQIFIYLFISFIIFV
jgi:hypothetical protein